MSKLNANFKIPKGVSKNQPFVQILDPATGTGTFLVEVIDLINTRMKEKWISQNKKDVSTLWNKYVFEKLLPRIYGFEIMMASYVIAHMKIGLKLKETGYTFKSKQKVNIHLANTLEEANDCVGTPIFIEFIGKESKESSRIKKETPITVIIGNPPYSVHSENKAEYIENLMETYKKDVRDERNIQPLSDDYIKFIRYAHSKIEATKYGIVGMITNSSFISGRIHRGMRKCLSETFSTLNIIDLHGAGRTALMTDVDFEGKDENVFSILQGVSISLFSRTCENKNHIYYKSYPGTKERKFQWLLSDHQSKFHGEELKRISPYYFFKKVGGELEEYKNYQPLDTLFNFSNVSGKPGQDELFVSYDKGDVIPKLEKFLKGLEEKDKIPKLTEAGKKILKHADKIKFKENNIIKYAYRPFDNRWTYYAPQLWTRAVKKLFNYVSNKPILLTSKIVKDSSFAHIFVTKSFPDVIFLSATSSVNCYSFPVGEDKIEQQILSEDNLNVIEISKELNKKINTIDFFNYIYGILWSPKYRKKYQSSLLYNFPRIPITDNYELFKAISDYGSQLISLHLLETVVDDSLKPKFLDYGRTISKVGEKNKKLSHISNDFGNLFINSKSYFEKIPINVWEFKIGGYQVCYKWLADRKKSKRSLTDNDLEHYRDMIVIISETLSVMNTIDNVIEHHGGWPGAFITKKGDN